MFFSNSKDIIIENDGVMDIKALTLIGASSKRGDNDKIGHFGSGNKYALAYLLRNNIPFKVYTDGKEIPITVEQQDFRGKDYGVIFVDGKETSLTTDMGPSWELWQAIREIYCNAVDEGADNPVRIGEYTPSKGKTAFVIESSYDVDNIVSNFSRYFCENTKVLFKCHVGEILQKQCSDKMRIFRKGILVEEVKGDFLFDYNLESLRINESRIPDSNWEWKEKVLEILYSCDKKEIVSQIINSGEEKELSIKDCKWIDTNPNKLSREYHNHLEGKTVATSLQYAFAVTLSGVNMKTPLLLPEYFISDCKDSRVNIKTLVDSTSEGVAYHKLEATQLQQKMLEKARGLIKDYGLDIVYPISVCRFGSEDMRGRALTEEKEILISEKSFVDGFQYLVETIMEEYVHIAYSVKDCTRQMQDVLLKLLSQNIVNSEFK